MKSSSKVSRFVSAAQIAVALAVAIYGTVEVLHPPFTNQEIQRSLADTWEVAALATLKILVVLAVSVVVSAVLVWRKAGRLAITALVLSLLAGAVTIYNHAALTNRTTQLTGQKFAGFYGFP